MSDQPSLSRGGMSPEGRTNPVGTLEPRLDPQDKKVLCSAVCHCSSTPNLSQDGKASSRRAWHSGWESWTKFSRTQPLQARGQLRHDQEPTAADSR